MHLEENRIELIIHANAPHIRRHARPLGRFKQAERHVRIVRKPRRPAPDVCVVPADLLGKAFHADAQKTEHRHDGNTKSIRRRPVCRRDSKLNTRERLLEHLHDAGDYRLVADVVAPERNAAQQDLQSVARSVYGHTCLHVGVLYHIPISPDQGISQ